LGTFGNVEHSQIVQAPTCVGPQNLGNVFGQSRICGEESKGYDVFAKHAGQVDASAHDPLDSL